MIFGTSCMRISRNPRRMACTARWLEVTKRQILGRSWSDNTAPATSVICPLLYRLPWFRCAPPHIWSSFAKPDIDFPLSSTLKSPVFNRGIRSVTKKSIVPDDPIRVSRGKMSKISIGGRSGYRSAVQVEALVGHVQLNSGEAE